MYTSEISDSDYDAIQALIHEHGPSEARRILRRERRAARAREASLGKRSDEPTQDTCGGAS